MNHPHTLEVSIDDDARANYTVLTAPGGQFEPNGDAHGKGDKLQQNDRRASGLVANGGHDSWSWRGIITDVNFVGDVNALRVSINRKEYPANDSLVERWQRDAGVLGEAPGPEPGPDVDHPPESTPDHNAIDPVARDEAIGGSTFHEVPADLQEPRKGNVSRFETTVRDATLKVDENHGGAFQNAANRLPKEIAHRVEVVLSDGFHGGNGSAIHTPVFNVKPTGRLIFRSESGDRALCHSESGINYIGAGVKQEHGRLRNIDFQNLSQFSGAVDVRGCGFAGFDEPGANAASTAAISGKNGRFFGKNNRIGSETDDYAIHSTIQEWYSLFGTKLKARNAAIRTPLSGEVDIGWGCSMDAPQFSRHHDDIAQGIYRGGRKVA